jgi:hypothetical protein
MILLLTGRVDRVAADDLTHMWLNAFSLGFY